jgi:hypothetical protein
MFPADRYVIRLATSDDATALSRLAAADSQRPLTGRTLVGELHGAPAAALSLDDGRMVADPMQPTAPLAAHLRMRAGALSAHERTPAVRERLLAAILPAARAAAAA